MGLPRMEFVLRLAIEWLDTLPQRDRSYAAFERIVQEQANTYAVPAEERVGILRAYNRYPDWKKPR